MLTQFIPMRKHSKKLSLVGVAALLVGTVIVTNPAASTAHDESGQAGFTQEVSQPEPLQNCTGSGDVLFYGNFECGTPEEWSPWPTTYWAGVHQFQRDTTNVRQGSFSGRFEVRDGDTQPNGTERAELNNGVGSLNGDTRYWAFSTYFPTRWAECDTWCIVSQWAGGEGPLFNFGLDGDELRLRIRTGECVPGEPGNCAVDIVNVLLSTTEFRNTTNMWHDWIVDAKLHYDPAGNHDGHVRVYHRLEGETGFTLMAEETGIPTLKFIDGQIRGSAVQRIGIYRRKTMVPTSIMWHDSSCVATTLTAAQSCLP